MTNDCFKRRRILHDVFPIYGEVPDELSSEGDPLPTKAEQRRGRNGEILETGLDDELTANIEAVEADLGFQELMRRTEPRL